MVDRIMGILKSFAAGVRDLEMWFESKQLPLLSLTKSIGLKRICFFNFSLWIWVNFLQHILKFQYEIFYKDINWIFKEHPIINCTEISSWKSFARKIFTRDALYSKSCKHFSISDDILPTYDGFRLMQIVKITAIDDMLPCFFWFPTFHWSNFLKSFLPFLHLVGAEFLLVLLQIFAVLELYIIRSDIVEDWDDLLALEIRFPVIHCIIKFREAPCTVSVCLG